MESSSQLNTASTERSYLFHTYNQNEHSSGVNINSDENVLSSAPSENNGKYLSLIHEDPREHLWYLVQANLKLMAEGKANLDIILYIIETFLVDFCRGIPFSVELLKEYFNSLVKKEEKELHTQLFSKMAKLILEETANLFPKNEVKILGHGPDQDQQVKLSNTQCLCIISHMFMCLTIPSNPKFASNFGWIFTITGKDTPIRTEQDRIKLEKKIELQRKIKLQKIRCLFMYFIQAFQEYEAKQERDIFFERIAAEEDRIKLQDISIGGWKDCEQALVKFEYYPKGEMEDISNMMKVAFSSKSFGGQSLRSELTQQEKLIFKSPECLVGILLFERVCPQEAFFVKGARLFNECKGYEGTFEWAGFYNEDKSKFENKEIIFIDASDFSKIDMTQFSEERIKMELNKAFIGFHGADSYDSDHNTKKPVSTGKWGCGIYKGNIHLKFLIQWIAASRAGRKMAFYGFEEFGVSGLMKDLQTVEKDLTALYTSGGKMMQVKDLVEDLLTCAKKAPLENNKEFNLFAELKNLRKQKK